MNLKFACILITLLSLFTHGESLKKGDWVDWRGNEDIKSRWFSEEEQYSYRQNYPAYRINMSGRYADKLQMVTSKHKYHRGATLSSGNNYWTGWFSEEGSAFQGCKWNYYIREIQCSDSYCNNKRLLCAPVDGSKFRMAGTQHKTGFYSEETGHVSCPTGYFARGMYCKGSYCDDIALQCFKLQVKCEVIGKCNPCGNYGPSANRVCRNKGGYNCCPSSGGCKASCDPFRNNKECCCSMSTTKISNIKYDFSKVSRTRDSSASHLSVTHHAENYDSWSSPIGTLTKQVSHTQSTSLKTSIGGSISTTIKVEGGVPFFTKGEFGVTTSINWGNDRTKTKSVTETIRITTGNKATPPYSRQTSQFLSETFTFSVPFTATATLNGCGRTETKTFYGKADIKGIASFTSAESRSLTGPSVPVECRSPEGTPIWRQPNTNFCSTGSHACYENALCYRFGRRTGVCCAPGSRSPCCAYAGAHPRCGAWPSDEVLCPTPQGRFHSCCDTGAFRPGDGINANNTDQTSSNGNVTVDTIEGEDLEKFLEMLGDQNGLDEESPVEDMEQTNEDEAKQENDETSLMGVEIVTGIAAGGTCLVFSVVGVLIYRKRRNQVIARVVGFTENPKYESEDEIPEKFHETS